MFGLVANLRKSEFVHFDRSSWDYESEKDESDIFGGDNFKIEVSEAHGLNAELLVSLLKEARLKLSRKKAKSRSSTAKVVPPLKLRLKASTTKSADAASHVADGQPSAAPVAHSISAEEAAPRFKVPKLKRSAGSVDTKTRDGPTLKRAKSDEISRNGIKPELKKRVRISSDTSSSERPPVTTSKKLRLDIPTNFKPVFAALKKSLGSVVKFHGSRTVSKSTGVSSVTTKSEAVTLPSFPRSDTSVKETGKKKHKSEKDRSERTAEKAQHEEEKLKKKAKKLAKLELRRKAKELAMLISKDGVKSPKRPHHTQVESLIKKAKSNAAACKTRKFGIPIRELFTRKSILDRVASPPKHSEDLRHLFGLGTSSAPAPAPASLVQPPFAQFRNSAIIGRCHSFVGNKGHLNRPLRSAGALNVQPVRPKEDTLFLDNLTAKVTKAVRQNGGFKTISSLAANWKEPGSKPRFTSRKPHRLFVVPDRYANSRKVKEQTWKKKDTESVREKSLASFFDLEMRAVMAGRTLNDDFVIAKRNAIHLYLHGVNSQYGDTANLESDMFRGVLTPAKVWKNPKPYVEMVIEGLKSRGRPHITYLSPRHPALENRSEWGSTGTNHFNESPAFGIQRNGGSDVTDNIEDISPVQSSVTPASPTVSFPNPSSMTTFFTASAGQFDDFGRPMHGNAGPFEFGHFIPPSYRPPPTQFQQAPPSSTYSDFQTRTW